MSRKCTINTPFYGHSWIDRIEFVLAKVQQIALYKIIYIQYILWLRFFILGRIPGELKANQGLEVSPTNLPPPSMMVQRIHTCEPFISFLNTSNKAFLPLDLAPPPPYTSIFTPNFFSLHMTKTHQPVSHQNTTNCLYSSTLL